MQISRISVNFQAKPQAKSLIKKADQAASNIGKYTDFTPTGENAAVKVMEAKAKEAEELKQTVEQYFPYGNIAGTYSNEATRYPFVSESTIINK